MTTPFDRIYNHDGFGLLTHLDRTAKTDDDADDLLVKPLADAGITVIDWCALTSVSHNCRTRHNLGFNTEFDKRELIQPIARVIQHYLARKNDLLDIVVQRAHNRGLKVHACLRMNHGMADSFRKVPGRFIPGMETGTSYGGKKDFRDRAYHTYLLEVLQDLLAKNVDGLTLDFERKVPFFPSDTPIPERLDALTDFVSQARRLTSRPIAARVAHAPATNLQNGQSPEAWLKAGLLDIIIPATHNHDPDPLNWPFDRFLAAAESSPRPARVWPQIWPTPGSWAEYTAIRHSDDALIKRTRDIQSQGAHGAYFFNFCCAWPKGEAGRSLDYSPMFKALASPTSGGDKFSGPPFPTPSPSKPVK